MNNNIAVYSAALGNAVIRDPHFVSKNFDYICFTDNAEVQSKVYAINCGPKQENPRLKAKEYKLQPQVYLSQYERSLWVDSGIEIISDSLYEELLPYMHVPFVLFETPTRHTVAEEVEYCLKHNKTGSERAKEQYEFYRAQGFPDTSGLMKGGFMLRQHNHPIIKKLDDLWWEHNQKFSTRDEVSLPFVIWKLGLVKDLDYCILPYDMRDNKLIKVHDPLI